MATIVAFHAHPDDEVLLTGGTLARLAAEGHRVVIVVATDGVMGPATVPTCGCTRSRPGRYAIPQAGPGACPGRCWRCQCGEEEAQDDQQNLAHVSDLPGTLRGCVSPEVPARAAAPGGTP
jgi:GlcNAc-PI de-N-acetylase